MDRETSVCCCSVYFFSACYIICAVSLIRFATYLESALANDRTDDKVILPFLHLKRDDPLQESRVGCLANSTRDVSLGVLKMFSLSLLGVRQCNLIMLSAMSWD